MAHFFGCPFMLVFGTWNLQTSIALLLRWFESFSYDSPIVQPYKDDVTRNLPVFFWQLDAFLKHQLWSNLEAQVEAETKLDQWMLCTWLQLYRLAMVSRSMHFRSGSFQRYEKNIIPCGSWMSFLEWVVDFWGTWMQSRVFSPPFFSSRSGVGT